MPGKQHIHLFTSNGLQKDICKGFSCVLTVMLCAVLAGSIIGCKSTDVLTEHVEDETLGVLDPAAEPKYKENPKAELDPRKSSEEVKDSTRTDAQEEKTPVYDKDAGDNGTAIWRKYDPNSPYNLSAAEGTLTSKDDAQTEKQQEKETNKKSSSSETKEKSDSGAKETQSGSSKSKKKGKLSVSSGIGGTGTVYNAGGKKAQLPENCNKVAAYGTYATIVQMLGGKGGLVAADSSWKAQVKLRSLFPNEGVSKIAAAWTVTESGNYKLNVKKLIKAEPDAILVDGVEFKLSSKQKKQLKNKKIDVITVPSLGDAGTSDSDVISAVNIVGELLKNSTTVEYSTQQSATTYEKMHESTLAACLKATGGYARKTLGGSSTSNIFQLDASGNTQVATDLNESTLTTVLFDSWVLPKKSTITISRSVGDKQLYLHNEKVDVSDGVGLSASVTNGSYALLDYYLQVSGVVNNAYETERPSEGSDGSSVPVVLMAGGPVKEDNDFLKDGDSWRGRTNVELSALWYSPTTVSTDSEMVTVGDQGVFPGVIASTDEIAQKIVTSANRIDGLYNVGQPYQVWVMPAGIDGSWSVGTPESYLSSVWALKTVWGDESAAETCDEYINNYYKTFYRCSSGTERVDGYDTAYTTVCPTE